MTRTVTALLATAFLLLAGCAETGRKGAAGEGPAKLYAGTYVGTEILGGRSFPIRIFVEADGSIEIIDVENIAGNGTLDGANFKIRRPRPFQMFEGSIEGGTITGKTWGNVAYGDGTFTATRK